jgi:hypothetical protein
MFYKQLKVHYSSRKFKEELTINCANKCFKDMRSDDLSRVESTCLINCFHKHYRYLTYANTLYSFLISDGSLNEFAQQEQETGDVDAPLAGRQRQS